MILSRPFSIAAHTVSNGGERSSIIYERQTAFYRCTGMQDYAEQENVVTSKEQLLSAVISSRFRAELHVINSLSDEISATSRPVPSLSRTAGQPAKALAQASRS